MPRLLILADDLTGAADAAAPFAARGARASVWLSRGEPDVACDVISYCTATRDVPSSDAVRSLGRQLTSFRSAELFKKIDSVFRGNTFHEVAATIRARPDHLAILAPAFPALGRQCTQGSIHVCDLAGQRTIPLLEPLQAVGVEPITVPVCSNPDGEAGDLALLRSTFEAAYSQGSRTLLCDGSTDTHLLTVVHAARGLGVPVLWIGSAGLAHALAADLYPNRPSMPPPPPLPTFLFTGSNHPVSLAQLALLQSSARIFRIGRNQTPNDKICEVVTRSAPRTLIMNGGDTALHVCRALGIYSLELQGEYAPGIPQAIARGGPCEGTTMVLKSGGFGATDLLLQLLEGSE